MEHPAYLEFLQREEEVEYTCMKVLGKEDLLSNQGIHSQKKPVVMIMEDDPIKDGKKYGI